MSVSTVHYNINMHVSKRSSLKMAQFSYTIIAIAVQFAQLVRGRV